MKRWFVTGTDTDVGKTYTACLLIKHLVSKGHRVAAMKPVASGSEVTGGGLRNSDAQALLAEINTPMDYASVNPFCYEPAIAPHIAAQKAGRPVDFERVCQVADSINAEHLVIEGAGGWLVPLDGPNLMPALVRKLKAEVILVVGMRLGCINHALLTANQISRDDCSLFGWVANAIDPDMPAYRENLETLLTHLDAPLLAEFPRNAVGNHFWRDSGAFSRRR